MAKTDNAKFLATARARFAAAAAAEANLRAEARIDFRFVAGEQWDPQAKLQRERAGRPALTHNRLPSFVAQIVNEARQQKPQIRFSPVEDADDDTAEVYEGLARHIQWDSQASTAYETAAEHQTTGGFGYFRILSDFVDGMSFDQELKIAAINDPFSVYGVLVPAIRGQKCRYAFVVESIPRDEYEATYGDVDDATSFAEGDDSGWVTETEVRIAEYWHLETRTRTIAQLEDGSVVEGDQVPEGVTPLRTRTAEYDVVKFCKIDGTRVIPGSETEWVGSSIPIPAVLGKTLIVDGEPQAFGLVRFLRDPQTLINYTKSRIAESLAAAPISPYMGVEGQFKGHEREWATINTTLRPYVEYRSVTIDGSPAPAPQRQVYEPPIAALSAFLAQEIDELKAISNIYDASLGDQGNETSGVAIARRQQQSNTANLHYIDNLTRAHELAGRIIAEAIPLVYDTARMVRILGADEEQKIARVNQPFLDPKTGQVREHILSAGKYDITVTSGRAYSTRKLETFDALSQLVGGKPELLQIIGDIVFRNSDMAGADEIAERFKKLLPPALADEQQQAAPVPPELQQKLQQSGQMIEQLTAALTQLQTEVDSKKLELESRERCVAMQEETKRAIAFATVDQRDGALVLQQELAMIRAEADRVHQAQMSSAGQSHQMQMQQDDRSHQMQMQQMQQEQPAPEQEALPEAA